jgi:hypothetical protein
MAGLPIRPGQHVDGISLLPVLKRTGSLNRDELFWHYPHYSNQGGKPGAAVRAGDYKLLEFFEDKRVELYNLREDISEKNDLSNTMPDKKTELLNKLHQWQNSVGAQFPDFNKGKH